MLTLGKSADEAVNRVEVFLKTLRKHAESLVEASNGITEQTGKAGQTFAKQVDYLMSSATKAAETAKQLEEAHDKAHTGKFLENTTYVIEHLHSMAVDIARIFQPSVEEELWKRYYKGEIRAYSCVTSLRRSAARSSKPFSASIRPTRSSVGMSCAT